MVHPGFERLSGLDTSFLLLESRDVYTHVASTLIFEAGPLRRVGGGIDFAAIEQAHEALLRQIPRCRQVLRFAPGTGQPYWVDDERFDLAYHLQHTSLPRPGTTEQLKQFSAQVMQQHLDRTRPLWETWVVEGLEGGRFALVTKVHHCMIDGLAGVDLLQTLLSPDPQPVAQDPEGEIGKIEWQPEPGSWALLRDDLAHRVRLPFDLVRDLGRTIRGASEPRRELAARARGALSTIASVRPGLSKTPLNQAIGPHRRFEWTVMDLDEIRAVKSALGGTVNDVVLAIAAGAFRRFLSERGGEDGRDGNGDAQVDVGSIDFRVLAPVSMRNPEEQDALGNQVSGWILRLPLAEADPKERLHQIIEQTHSFKASQVALGAALWLNFVEWTPATLLALGARRVARTLPFNSIVTNVPGPRVPMFLQGARLIEAIPHVPLIDRVALGIGLISYSGRLHWGINGDYDAVPDISAFMQALESSFDELRSAAGLSAAAGSASRPEAPEFQREEAETDASRQARRTAFTDLARERHDALTDAIDRLERALAAPAAQRAKPWSERVAIELRFVREAIDAHVQTIEAPRGLLDELQTEKPWLTSRVLAVKQEHASMIACASALASKLPGDDETDFVELRHRAADLLATLRGHRATEADLTYEAFWTDLGGVD